MNHTSLLKLRETKYVSSQLDTVRLDGTFVGYASVFNEKDLGNDIVAPGAFANSLKARGAANIRMLFQHNPDEPIGVWESIVETNHGLQVTGRITTAVARGREVLELMRAGAVDGLSIGFRTQRARHDPINQTRRILQADLWEISIVTFPMQESARVESVKSGGLIVSNSAGPSARNLPTIREFERWLVRDAGLSRADAHLVITKGYRNTLNRRDAIEGSAGENSHLAACIRSAASLVSTSINRKTT